ncbi:hypothetical protein LZD49_04325 [Dyadobacter sp. CY261]|uniref:hypothetical protein n=1 Tax=Dyadobacter sp. CY261 TaxID=2907203 RepID=UPI001F1C78D7|nr:hypothetical protein [Dyadobacter sp. CY261]MCF0069685.1 hypothetical protein [Dyadobacter sp. CY261]
MMHEKIFIDDSLREVKIIVKGYPSTDQKSVSKFFDVMIREAGQSQFQRPINLNLPIAFDAEKIAGKQLVSQVMAANGIREKDVEIAVTEFNEIVNSSVLW